MTTCTNNPIIVKRRRFSTRAKQGQQLNQLSWPLPEDSAQGKKKDWWFPSTASIAQPAELWISSLKVGSGWQTALRVHSECRLKPSMPERRRVVVRDIKENTNKFLKYFNLFLSQARPGDSDSVSREFLWSCRFDFTFCWQRQETLQRDNFRQMICLDNVSS